jgi:Recombinase/Recombinase zinc beta ribbon domain
MSEAELHVLKARLQGGIHSKARRGELPLPLPVGLVYDAVGTVALDPDRQIQDTVRLIFSTFREVRSATATVRRFQREGLQFPQRARGTAGEVRWIPLEHFRVLQILHNPRYAGAFVYGRTRGVRTADLKSTTHVQVPRKEWMVLIKNAHVGYVSWEEFERNQSTLKQNLTAFGSGGRGTLPREGTALLQGHVVCGRCGARMRTRYQQLTDRQVPYYVCTEEVVRRGGKTCQSIRGQDIDAAISEVLLRTVAPAAIEVSLAVQEEITGRIDQADALRQKQLERARYEAELKRRRFLKCDPNHRLVADALEADWNEQLRRLEVLQKDHERQHQADQDLLSDTARAHILALAHDFPRVWNDPHTEPRERKRMLALLVEDVTLLRTDAIAVHVRFRGGQTTSLTVEAPKPIALIRKFDPQVIDKLDQLLDTCTDQEAADRLNALGYRNWRQQPFTRTKVISIRFSYRLKSRYERLRQRGLVSAEELAQRFKVSPTTIHEWGREGRLPRHQYDTHRCLYEPLQSGTIRKGKGGRRPQAPVFINVRTSKQETV